MSKSLGNFFTVREILERYDGEAIRFFLLSGHYRSPIDFNDGLMDMAKASLGRLENARDNLKFLAEIQEGNTTEAEKHALNDFEQFRVKFKDAMDDDLNTADAIVAIFELVTEINKDVKDGCSQRDRKSVV